MGHEQNVVVGLDIGANSVGWAVIAVEQNGDGITPQRILQTGARVFDAGMDGALDQGKEESRNTVRREARLIRRRLERTGRRLEHLYHALSRAGLLPSLDLGVDRIRLKIQSHKDTEVQARNQALKLLDLALSRNEAEKARQAGKAPEEIHHIHQVIAYRLRARALDEGLEPFELGRALYHLGQRRGFKTNRKSPPKADEKPGVVDQDVTELETQMKAQGARTLGEYFSGIDPETTRIRQRWTARRFYEHEFEQIWKAQQPHHPDRLTDTLKERVHQAIFYQRPLKSQKHLIGECELEKGQPRAIMGCLEFQRFRMLQGLNHTKVIFPDGTERGLATDERQILLEQLEVSGELAFSKAKKRLKFPTNARFNMEEGEEKFIGNRTAGKLVKVLGQDRWAGFFPADRAALLHDLMSIREPEVLARRAQKVWGLDVDKAKALSEIKLEDQYASLSRKAFRKLLPHMEQGLPYANARLNAYGETPPKPVHGTLPPLDIAVKHRLMPPVRNPTVTRVMAEVQHLVNALIRQYGKPVAVRIELARDLRNSKSQRQAMHKSQMDNRKLRDKASKRLLNEMGIQNPRHRDIEKVLLLEECKGTCPYTGKGISMDQLFGPNSEVDVEHIIPFSRSLDDSFANKTLCYAEANRNVKRGHTPYEAYGQTENWEAILQQVDGFHSEKAREKARRFRMTSQEVAQMLENFTTTQLNDTRYATSLAMDYLGLLYGGQVDGEGKRRVQASRGQLTAYLRNEWNLNRILADGGEKTREDHRHHALDAIVTALADQKAVHMLSSAAAQAMAARKRRFAPLPSPWEGFLENVREQVDKIVVSHRVNRKLNGALHEATHYAKPVERDGKTMTRVRKRLESMGKNDIENIVDGRVKAAVLAKLAELGAKPEDAKKVFANPANHPFLLAKDGRRIPIHAARVWLTGNPMPIAKGTPRERHVMSESNHHLAIYEVANKKGNPKWEGVVVSRHEAMRRKRAGEPVVQRGHRPGTRFVFTLAPGETIQMGTGDKVGLFIVQSIWMTPSGARLRAKPINDARKASEIEKWQPMVSGLQEFGCQKVTVTPLGEVRRAND